MMCHRIFVSAILAVLLLAPGPAKAQSEAPPATKKGTVEKGTSDKSKGRTEKPNKGKRRMPTNLPKYTELQELVVEGKIRKPTVMYVLSKSQFRYKGMSLEKSFLDRIRKSVRGNPF
jgi:hypothetical protein